MSKFGRDLDWSVTKRDMRLKPYYALHSEEGRYVFCDKGSLARKLQTFSVDTILQGSAGRVWAIEEKIVRWPGYVYTAFTLETWSCTVPGHEREGWMYTAQCDYLVYCFEQEDASLLCYALPFQRLQQWFIAKGNFTRYRATYTNQRNRTECRIVPIQDVLRNVPGCKVFRPG